MSRRISRRRLLHGSVIATGALAAGIGVPRLLKAAVGAWGDLVGRLVYDGAPPERKKLKVDKDVDCCGKFDIRDESLMVGSDGGLANVFVYARTRKIAVCPELEQAIPKRVKLDNRDCIFKPHCMTIWHSKQEFFIVNSDPIAQNVDFRPLGDLPANIILSPAPGTNVDAAWRFNKMQLLPVPIACNYHPWESAYILARDNPYVAISAGDGSFRIPKLPVGKIEFQVWQERAGYVETPAWPRGRFQWTIQPGVNDLGTIKVPAAKFEKK